MTTKTANDMSPREEKAWEKWADKNWQTPTDQPFRRHEKEKHRKSCERASAAVADAFTHIGRVNKGL